MRGSMAAQAATRRSPPVEPQVCPDAVLDLDDLTPDEQASAVMLAWARRRRPEAGSAVNPGASRQSNYDYPTLGCWGPLAARLDVEIAMME